MTNAGVVSGAALWTRAGRLLARGWGRIGKGIQNLWQWVFPPVPAALRRSLVWGLGWMQALFPYSLLVILELIVLYILFAFFPNPPGDPFMARIWKWSIIIIIYSPVAFFLWQVVRIYMKYRRVASWILVKLHGRYYEVPRALALRSAFLVPAILDYLHRQFDSEIVRKHIVGRRRLIGGSRFPWQETLISPLSGRIYTLPRSRWQRFIENAWNQLIWMVTHNFLRVLYFVFPSPEGKSQVKKWFRKILKMDKKTIKKSVLMFSLIILVGVLGYLMGQAIALFIEWFSKLLGINSLWFYTILLIGWFIMVIWPYIRLERDVFSNFRAMTYVKMVTDLYPLKSFSRKKSKCKVDRDAELVRSAEEPEPNQWTEKSSEPEVIQAPEAELSSSDQEEQEKTKKDTPEPDPKEEIQQVISKSFEILGEIMARSMTAAYLSIHGHKLAMDDDPLWAHALGMGFLWEVPSDEATVKRYQALPAEAKRMMDAILYEVLRHFNNPESEYTAMAYPEMREKWTYGYLPDGRTPFRLRYPETESFEIIERETLPTRSDYILEEDLLIREANDATRGSKTREVIIVGWGGGYGSGDYARLFRSSIEMKASFWAAYQAAWRIMRMVSEGRDDGRYFGEPLTLPVRSGKGYVHVKGVAGFCVEWF